MGLCGLFPLLSSIVFSRKDLTTRVSRGRKCLFKNLGYRYQQLTQDLTEALLLGPKLGQAAGGPDVRGLKHGAGSRSSWPGLPFLPAAWPSGLYLYLYSHVPDTESAVEKPKVTPRTDVKT